MRGKPTKMSLRWVRGELSSFGYLLDVTRSFDRSSLVGSKRSIVGGHRDALR